MNASDDNKKPKKHKKNWHETETSAQYSKILEMLKPYGESVKSTHDFRRGGVMQPGNEPCVVWHRQASGVQAFAHCGFVE